MVSRILDEAHRHTLGWFGRPRTAWTRRRGRFIERLALEQLEPRTLLSGTWTWLSNPAPSDTGTALLLSDGTVMVQGGLTYATNTWYRLTPDLYGGYADGTWSQLASMSLARSCFPSNVLPDGRVLVMGGEYTGPTDDYTLSNTGEIYDPVANTWTSIANFPESELGDCPSEVLPGGNVIVGSPTDGNTYIYNPSTNTWSFAGTKTYDDPSEEETWLKLPDNSVLNYDTYTVGAAERYIPAQNEWVSTGAVTAVLSNNAIVYNIGPAVLLPDGRAFYVGGTNSTAFYSLSTNSWTAGPDLPDGLAADDAAGAMMANGDVLLALSPEYSNGEFYGPTSIYEFDPSTNTYTNVTPAGYNLTLPSFATRMLDLPSGQVLLTNGSNQILLYTPSGSPAPSWRPQISQVTANSDGTYTLTGTQLNGISQGASYGDDAEMDTNYPIVQLVSASGGVYYARTFDWSSTGVATGSTPVSTLFTLPAGFLPGTYELYVVANGIASAPVTFTYDYASSTTVAASVPVPVYGQPATFIATVTGSGSTGSTPTGTVQFVVDGSDFGAPVALANGEATSISTQSLAAGMHTVTALYSGDGYFAASRGTLSQPIQQAVLTVTANPESMTYGGTVPALTYSVSGLASGDTVGSALTGALDAIVTSSSTVGDYPITQGTLTASANYKISFTPEVLAITPATLDVTALDQSMFAGGTVPALTYSTSGLVNGDSARSVLSGALVTTATSSSSVGVYPISQGTLNSDADYTIQFHGGTLTILPMPPLVTLAGVRLQTNSKHLVTQIILTFSGALSAADAGNTRFYRLTTAGKNGSFTARNAAIVTLRGAIYDPVNDSVTLTPKKPFALSKPVQLLVYGTAPAGMQDSYGRLIDGDHTGRPGSNAEAILTRGGITLE